jgi:hypothetical protein
MGIETSAEHGGAEASFVSAIIAIEELAKIDPSVSVMCDVHNTLVNTILRKYGTKEQQDKWLPLLSESKVSRTRTFLHVLMCAYSLVPSACLNLCQVQMLSRCRQGQRRIETIG